MSQWGFVGQAYQAPDPRQDAQVCVNWYPEISQDADQKSKTVIALLGCPGLVTLLTLPTFPVRGALTLPGGSQALAVGGSILYLISVAIPASATAKAVLQYMKIGAVNAGTGPVFMKDNGVGGVVYIVDGSATGYTYNVSTQKLTFITDPAFYGANRIAFIDGWNVFNKPGTPIFYTSPPPPYTVTPFNGSYFDLNDGTSDQLVTLIEDKRELLLVNEYTAQWWYDAGGVYFPFSRLDGATMQVGCAAPNTIALFQDGVIWLARSQRGQNVVVQTTGFNYADVSHIGVNHAIASYNYIADAFGFTYQEDGHEFYVLTFPTADATWVYDGTTKMWHQRASYDPVAGVFHRHRSNCYFQFQNYRLVGDYQNGNIYSMDRKVYTDNGAPLIAWRRTPHVWDEEDYERVFQYRLQIDFTPGLATSVGQGSNPQAIACWSDDGGQTYGPSRLVPIGLSGQTQYRALIDRLGDARDRVYDVRFSDPCNRDITGAALIAET